jgi:uncharacterized repeat protein (TIGR03803 family)
MLPVAARSDASVAHPASIGTKAFKTLYTFQGRPDGANPYSPLLDVGGVLYGTTNIGGSYGWGSVFKITKSGKESVVYSFHGPASGDGSQPCAGLTYLNKALYGTTSLGGTGSGFCGGGACGTVFKITLSGAESLLYSFGDGSNGGEPEAGLLAVNGLLYGTTRVGGAYGYGTVFTITPSGTETVLHSFNQHSADGFNPQAGLLNVNGALYGTTDYGGSANAGTVFQITPAGTESVLHSFRADSQLDGNDPFAGLIDVNGVLYGTTTSGGSECVPFGGCGTVFTITTAGSESVIYSFKGYSDGRAPAAGLVAVKGMLYGTTAGTIFKLTTSGAETVLHRFTDPHGAFPFANLIDVGGTLYGTTIYTASGQSGNGTVFSLSL